MPMPNLQPLSSEALAEKKNAPAAKSPWPRYPSLYEINTWVWLSDLSEIGRAHV